MIRDFFKLEAAPGLLLILTTILALVFANSPLDHIYEVFLSTTMGIQVGTFEISKPLLLWINDGLMAIFFFLIGLELKRELIEGELSDPKQVIMPAAAAVGGMLVPAMVYVGFNWSNDLALAGWAIPAATDIAFALGILAMLGSRVPLALKIFLVSLAIIDDIGAIVIIALFYTSDLSVQSLVISGISLVILYVMNKKGVTNITPFI